MICTDPGSTPFYDPCTPPSFGCTVLVTPFLAGRTPVAEKRTMKKMGVYELLSPKGDMRLWKGEWDRDPHPRYLYRFF